MTRYFRAPHDPDRTPTALRIVSPEVHQEPDAPRWSWDGEEPTPFALGAVIVGLAFSTAGLAVLVYALIQALR